ncbi:MAG TPA: LuxR C-terminal-related transcriptional regulator [Pirellulaceae bacterium]|nr:LuxR C-terminal-related transcriptional regulator [Pirellulaceae bacterium]
MQNALSITLSGSSRLTREALAARLNQEPDCVVDAVIADRETLLDHLATTPPDVVFILLPDFSLPQWEALFEVLPATTKLLCQGGRFSGSARVFDLALQGRLAWIDSDLSYAATLAALRQLTDHQMVFSPQLLAEAAKQIQHHQHAIPTDEKGAPRALIKREGEIADLVGEGLINKQTAGRLGIRVAMVQSRVNDLLRKLQVRNRGDVRRRAGQRLTPRCGKSQPARTCTGL